MAAAFKTSKSELVAIYRLEFYRKQKNWKFCTAERKKEEERRRAAKNAKSKLNQTYNIEPAPERDKSKDVVADEVKHKTETDEQGDVEPVPTEERTDNLNEAFVDTETDDNATTPLPDFPTGPYSPKWSIQQWAARCRPVWNCEPIYPNQQYHVPHDPNQYLVRSDLMQPFPIEEPVGLDQAITNYEEDMRYKIGGSVPHTGTGLPQHGDGANVLDLAKLRDWEQMGSYEGCNNGWPTQTQVWTSKQEGWFEEICDIPEEAIEAIEAAEADAVDGTEWALVDRAEDWLRSTSPLDKGALGRSDSLPSVSSGSFCRGAALAPHSTEVELLAPRRAPSPAPGPALSGAALAAEVARHAAALKALLGEAKRRDVQVSPSPTDQLHSFDEYPTRDVGPSHMYNTPPPIYAHHPTPSSVYTHNPTVINDVFVAGSFRNGPDLRGQTDGGTGRGRGRKVRVIGIEMGRPYRL